MTAFVSVAALASLRRRRACRSSVGAFKFVGDGARAYFRPALAALLAALLLTGALDEAG